MNTKSKVFLAFVTLFLVGFASGYLFSNAISPSGREYTEESRELAEGREQLQRSSREGRDGSRAERIRKRLTNVLDLSSDQQDPFFEQMSAYRFNLRSELKEMRERENELVKENYEEFRNDLSDVLNQEQLQEMDSYMHPDSVIYRRRRGERGPAHSGDN